MMKTINPKPSQVSVQVSSGTKEKLEYFVRSRGLKKTFILEQALQYYFRALELLPEEAFIPPRIVLNEDSWSQVMEAVENPPPPTDAMLELMNGHQDSSPSKNG